MRTIEELLRSERQDILEEAEGAVARLEHYRRDGERATRRRLEALYREVAAAVERRDLTGIVAHASGVARERFETGFEYPEIFAAFSSVETAIRRRVLHALPPDERALGLGLVGTAFAHGKAALGRTFASLASAPALDLTPLFRGADSASDESPPSESVHPV